MARMRSLHKLAGHFLDVVAGLPTLKVFGRAKAQAQSIADVTDRYRSTTLATLRLTFLSSLILELLATVSVALVAVAVGLRLLDGDMSFHDVLFVLVLRARRPTCPLTGAGTPTITPVPTACRRPQDVFALLEQPSVTPAGGSTKAGRNSHPPQRLGAHLPRLATSPRSTVPRSSLPPGRRWRSPGPAGAASQRSCRSSWACVSRTAGLCPSAAWTSPTWTSTTGAPHIGWGASSGPTSSPVRWPRMSDSADPTPPTTQWQPRSRPPD